jgi:hypothetical protein
VIIKVHQSLHGYSDGHRQLASSFRLSLQDAKLVLVMSDVSGSGVAAEGSSYLTGYPLQDAGMYALARTWSAPEMTRPGCVWTHTLFIEFPDLATVSAPSRLAKLFARPESPAWSSYGVPKELELRVIEEPEPQLSLQDEAWLATVLNALYRFPRDRVVAKRDAAVSVETLTLRIWDQQWPRLRRSFRFCTFTTKDRSASGGAFDLQVLPGIDSANRMRLPGTQEAPSVADHCLPGWLTTLMDDARLPNIGGLRDTLKRLGADILGGREAMPTLCEFHRLTSGSGSPSDMHEAISMLELPGLLSSSDLARAQVADQVLSSVEDADPPALAFLWDNWQYIGFDRLQQRLPEVAGPLWRATPRRLLNALRNQADEASGWAVRVVKALPTAVLVEDWPEGDVPLRELLTVRPDLLEVPAFWSVADVRSSSDLQGIVLPDQAIGALLRGMERETAMRAAVKLLGPLRVLDALQSRSRASGWEISELRWVQYCVWDASAVAEFLSRVEAPSVPLLLEFTVLMSPDVVPNHYGDDPWYTVLLKVRSQTGSLPNRLAAYGFARALGSSSRSVAELLQMTFEQLHAAVASSTLEEAQWQLIEPRLPWVTEHKRWDRGGRLRNVVVGIFMDRRLWARAFAWMAANNDVFIALMEEAADRWGGRRFLKSVEESLEHEHDAPTSARRELIHSFVRSRGRL